MKKQYLQLHPDAFTRFRSVSFILEKVAKDNKPGKKYSILDIGGSSIFMYDFLAESKLNFELTIIDPRPKPAGLNSKIIYIQSTGEDAVKLGKKFDFCIMIDMLEHVAGPANKKSVLESAIELTTGAVVIAGPFDDKQTDSFEHLLNDINKDLFGVDQDWLLEHFECEKPTLSKVLESFKKADWNTTIVNTLPFNFWLASAFTNLTPASSELIKQSTVESINSEFNTKFENNPTKYFSDQGYRKIIVASKNDLDSLVVNTSEENPYLDFELQYSRLLSNLIAGQSKKIGKLGLSIESLNKDIYLADEKNRILTEENTQIKARTEVLERHIAKYRRMIGKIPFSKPAVKLIRKIKK